MEVPFWTTVDLQYWVQFPFFQINTAQIPKAIYNME
jgi:hypothetical protein